MKSLPIPLLLVVGLVLVLYLNRQTAQAQPSQGGVRG